MCEEGTHIGYARSLESGDAARVDFEGAAGVTQEPPQQISLATAQMLLTSCSRLAKKRRPVTAAIRRRGEAEVFWPSAMSPEGVRKIKYGGAVHFPSRRPGALI